MSTKFYCFSLIVFLLPSIAHAQPEGFNYDESKVPQFLLPDPLTLENGNRVTTVKEWQEKCRPEILKLFETHVYGRSPSDASKVRFSEAVVDTEAFDGKAVRKQVKIYFGDEKRGLAADLLIYLPANRDAPTPVFLGLNFRGNHTVTSESQIRLPSSWIKNREDNSVVNNQATDKGRGCRSSAWPVRGILARGYAVATIYCGDLDPDFDDDFQQGIHPLFYQPGQTQPADDEWGTLAAWAWGLSRALDYIETDPELDHERTVLIGHSRLGKAALWAGARDQRFAMVISNNSGCGGAALSRRKFGETVQRINTSFPYWFCKNFHKYNNNEDALPVDQHMLAALIAPRPLYIASAEQDPWADPRGEFLSLQFASPVYELFGKKALSGLSMPEVNQPILRDVAYHIRKGKHGITRYDWQRYMDFADRQFYPEKD